MAQARGVISVPRTPWSKQGDLGSEASLPVTLAQTPPPSERRPSVISEDGRTISMFGDYVVTPIKSRRPGPRRVYEGPYPTRSVPALRRMQETRRRNLDTGQWSRANTRGSDIPPVNWLDNRASVDPGALSDDRIPPRLDVKYVGRDPKTGNDFVETKRGTRKYLGEPFVRRDNKRRRDLHRFREQPHPRRGYNARTETLPGTFETSPTPHMAEWSFIHEPSARNEYNQQFKEYIPRREFRPPPSLTPPPPLQLVPIRPVQPSRVYSTDISKHAHPGSIDKDVSSDDSVQNFKGSDLDPKEPRIKEFVPHWGYYVETPPSPGQSVKPRQGSVLDPHYRPRSRPLERNLLSPASISKSMVPDHGSTLTSPSENASVHNLSSNESGFHEISHRGQAYNNAGNYAPQDYNAYQNNPGNPYQPGPNRGPIHADYTHGPRGPQARVDYRGVAGAGAPIGGAQVGRYSVGATGRNVRFENGQKEKWYREVDRNYLCSISGVLKIVQFITSCIIAGITRADPNVWALDLFILLVGVFGILLSISSFFFRVFRWDDTAHLGCLWFEFSCYFVMSILMFTAAILSTLNANLAPSLAALTFFCYVGAGVFTADTIILGAGIAKRGLKNKSVEQNPGDNEGPQNPQGPPPQRYRGASILRR